MSDSHNIPRTSLNKPVANQGFLDANLGGHQHLGGLSQGIHAAENLLHGGHLGGQQLVGGQQILGQQCHLGGQQILGEQILGGQQIVGQQFVAEQQLLGQPQMVQGQTTVSQESSVATASMASKIITIEETPAIITTVTTREAPVQVETHTNLIQETIQSMRQEIVQPVIQPVVEMKEEIIGMQPIIGTVPVTTGYVETGYVQSQGLVGQQYASQGLVGQGYASQGYAGQGLLTQGTMGQGLLTQGAMGQGLVGSIISSAVNTLPLGTGSSGFASTLPLNAGLNQPINTGLTAAPALHKKKKRGLFHRKPKDTTYGENRYV